MSRQVLIALVIAVTARVHVAHADGDAEQIRATALDYIDGFYDGDVARMTRAIHPELVKRIVKTDPKTKAVWIETMGATLLVEKVREGIGRTTPAAQRLDAVKVLDIFGDAAVARIDAATWVDYLQLHRWNGRWVIVNVLWELKPAK